MTKPFNLKSSNTGSGTPMVSLVVPVYNVEAYLPECLDSILRQTYTRWELILVDDGSPDNSPAICDDYAIRDDRIRVIHKPNTGKADSCNLAISEITGDYFGLIDSDDWIEPTYLETLMKAILQTGIQTASTGYVYSFIDYHGPMSITDHQVVLDQNEAITRFYSRQLDSFICGRLFHRSLLQEPIPHLRRFEDQAVLYKWLSHGNGMVLCPECLYHYRQRCSSVMNSGETAFGLVPIMEECHQFVAECQLLPKAENNAIIITQLVREAKWAAREGTAAHNTLTQIRDFLRSVDITSTTSVDRKTLKRYQLLMKSPRLFSLKEYLSGLFIHGHCKEQHKFFP